MIKVDALETDDSFKLNFETKNTSPEGLEELDLVYTALMGSEPRIGGYTGTNRFEIEVKKST